MNTAILLFDGVTALDAIGPYEVLSRLPNAHVRFLAGRPGPVRTDNGMLALHADHPLDEAVPADILLVPGGPGVRRLLDDERTLSWVRETDQQSTVTASVCTGSLALAAAGLLAGVDATTHWSAREELRELGANPVGERVVHRGKMVTAAGVSAGIDMALYLSAALLSADVAKAIQLLIEYDPEPPFDCGSPDKAPASVRALAMDLRAQSISHRVRPDVSTGSH